MSSETCGRPILIFTPPKFFSRVLGTQSVVDQGLRFDRCNQPPSVV